MAQFPKMSRKKALTIASACMLSFVPVFAQDEEEDLDLGALFDLNMEVTVASKKAEKISDAPGMIVAWSDKDIRNLGYFTLRDLANQTTGFSTYAKFGEQVFEARGQKADSWNNNKHLLLVDGIPVHNARNYKAPTEEDLSLIGAQRVEFLKGPGSALYGTGAFYGVVSVVPKTLKENGTWNEARIKIGTEDLSKTAMAATVTKTDKYEFSASASYFDKEAGRQSILQTDSTFDGYKGGKKDTIYVNQDSRNSQFVNFSYKLTDSKLAGLGAGLIYTRKAGDGGEFWSGLTTPVNEVVWQSIIPYIRYQKDFTDGLSFNSYVKANQSSEFGAYVAPWAAGLYREYNARVNDLEILAETQIALNEGKAGDITTGVNYDVRKQLGNSNGLGYEEIVASLDATNNTIYELSSVSPSLLYNTLSFYGQYQKEFPVLSGLKLTAGFREDIGFSKEASNAEDAKGTKLNREGNTYSQFSPRAGVVMKWTDFLNTKVLYGTALRAPGIKEAGQNSEAQATINKGAAAGTNTAYDIKDIGPEVIKTIEGSINVSFPKISGSLAYFYNITSNPLDGKDVGAMTGDATLNGQSIFVNGKGEVRGSGLEADFAAMPIPSLKVMAGVGFSKMVNYYTDSTVVTDTVTKVSSVVTKDMEILPAEVPTGKLNAAIAYNHQKGYKFSITPALRTYFGYRLGGELKDEEKKTTDAFTMLDCNVALPVTENLGIEVFGKNIMGTEYYQPNGIATKERSVAVSIVGKF